MPIGPNSWLFNNRTQETIHSGGLELSLIDQKNVARWEIKTSANGLHVAGEFFSRRYVAHHYDFPDLYLLITDEPHQRPHPKLNRCVLPNPTRYHLLSFHVVEGRITGDAVVDEGLRSACRIEAVDAQGVLVSLEGTLLKYFRRIPFTPR